MRPRHPRDFRPQHENLFSRQRLPLGEVHLFLRFRNILFHQPRYRRETSIPRPTCLLRMAVCAFLPQHRLHFHWNQSMLQQPRRRRVGSRYCGPLGLPNGCARPRRSDIATNTAMPTSTTRTRRTLSPPARSQRWREDYPASCSSLWSLPTHSRVVQPAPPSALHAGLNPARVE